MERSSRQHAARSMQPAACSQRSGTTSRTRQSRSSETISERAEGGRDHVRVAWSTSPVSQRDEQTRDEWTRHVHRLLRPTLGRARAASRAHSPASPQRSSGCAEAARTLPRDREQKEPDTSPEALPSRDSSQQRRFDRPQCLPQRLIMAVRPVVNALNTTSHTRRKPYRCLHRKCMTFQD